MCGESFASFYVGILEVTAAVEQDGPKRTRRVQRRNDEAPCADQGFRTFRICGPELTGQGFMRRGWWLLPLVDLGKRAIP